MKKLFYFSLTLACAFLSTSYTTPNVLNPTTNTFKDSVIMESTDCSYNGIELYGRVQFVESFPDLKIQVVESFPDIKVKLVESFADDCGEWQIVESFPDFKVQIVESFADLKVQYVESFPGIEE